MAQWRRPKRPSGWGQSLPDNSVIAFAAFTLSIAYTAKGDLGQALAYGELAVDKAPTPGDKVWSQSTLSWALCRAGQPQRGVEFLAKSVAMQRAARFIWSEVCALWLGEGYWRLGEHDKARQTLRGGRGHRPALRDAVSRRLRAPPPR